MMRLGLLACLFGATLGAQTGVTVNGVAYDSLRSMPLAGALVAIAGTSHSTTTDGAGRFRFDGVAPGTLTFTLQHDNLDSAGFSGLSRKIVVTDGRAPVAIALPSFATLWKAACGERRESPDSGFVFGTVRDAIGGRPLAGAHVEISWTELFVKNGAVSEKRYGATTESDARGSYGVCGVPVGAAARARVTTATGASGVIVVPTPPLRVTRLDLSAGASDSVPEHLGVVRGIVTGASGGPIAGARVSIENVPEVRTGTDGQFIVRGVPSGTRQLEVLAIGMAPVLQVVTVAPNDTATVSVRVDKVTTLKAVDVNAVARRNLIMTRIDDRMRAGLGHFIDSTMLMKSVTLPGAFMGVPSVRVRAPRGSSALAYRIMLPLRGSECLANLFVDGVKISQDILDTMRPDDFRAAEVYVRRNETPIEFSVVGSECGSVAFWTANAFR